MNKKQIINKYLKDCSNDTILVEKIITKIYLDENKIDFTKSKFLFNYLSAIDDDLYRLFHEYSKKIELKFTLNDLIEFFELLIPSAEKKMNGMVYTPYNIKRYMIDMAFKGINDISDNLAICDPSCGCGSFLVSVAQYMHYKFGLSFSSIVNEHLYGVDIFEHNIEKAKVLFNILSLENGELLECSFNLYAFDSMVMDWEKCFDVVFQNGGFDIVIGNPPYVSAKNMSESTRTSLKNWKTAQHGKVDLYIPFYELGLNILRENGDLFFITINTFLKSINARGFRNLIIKSGYEIEVIDFSASQMFKDILSYTAITMIHKGQTNHSIKYVNYKSTDIDALENVEFSMYNSNEYEENEPWYLVNSSDIMHLEKLKHFPVTLKEYNIKNGLATLRNDIYFFTPI